MNFFLIVFFTAYTAMNAYAFLKARAAFALSTRFSLILIIIMALLIITPVIVRYTEKAGYESPARIMAYVGYMWLAYIFLFCSISIVLDIYRLLVYALDLAIKKDIAFLNMSPRMSFLIPLFLSLIISFYGYFEAKNIRIEKITIKTPKLPPETGTLRIAQISDLHIGLIIRGERLKKIVQKIQDAQPDILVSTGDLFDGRISQSEEFDPVFKDINPKYGKFAITGNHEFYAGLNHSIDFTSRSGFKMLRGEYITIEGIINIAGVDDPAGKFFGTSKNINEKNLLSEIPNEEFTLLLKHRPLVDKNAIGLFDLQLSGHVHKGQIFPFSIITWLYYPNHAGFAHLPNRSFLYVSRGTGTWGPPIRFLAPPEITVIELVAK